MRNAFMDELITAARVRDDIVLIIGDLGYSVIEPFADEFPDRFFNAGIAEQNMMGMAAGMASEGMQVFTYSIGNFPTWRCAEQIRNDVDYHNLPVTNVVVGGGVTYGSLGYSHHAIQELAIMRALQNMMIATPIDSYETKLTTKQILEIDKGPSYLRLGKQKKEFQETKQKFVSGEPRLIVKATSANNKAVIAIGQGIVNAEKFIMENKNEYDLYSLPIWGIKYKERLKKWLQGKNKIIVFEDHMNVGGLGSWLKEISNSESTKIIQKGLTEKIIGTVAKEETLLKISED